MKMNLQTFSILFTIILVNVLISCIWLTVDEITTNRRWTRVAFTLVGIVLSIIDILIIWM